MSTVGRDAVAVSRTFSVPARYIRDMIVVADLASGGAGAIEDGLEAAWQLQRSAGQ